MSYQDCEPTRSGFNFIEQARNKELARNLAVLQDVVVEKLLRLADQNPARFDLIGYRDVELIWFYVFDVTLQGAKEVGVGLVHSFLGSEENHQKVGVDTSNRVSLGLYTDRKTWETFRQLYAYDWEERFGFTLDEVKEHIADIFTEEEVDDMTFPDAASDTYGTHYFVDMTGDFAKVVSIPEEFAEGRTDLQIEGHPIEGAVTVQAPMYARDFVLMKVALDAINQELEKELQQLAPAT